MHDKISLIVAMLKQLNDYWRDESLDKSKPHLKLIKGEKHESLAKKSNRP